MATGSHEWGMEVVEKSDPKELHLLRWVEHVYVEPNWRRSPLVQGDRLGR